DRRTLGQIKTVTVSDVQQTPILWEREGDSASMQCNHTKGVGYRWMYWFRQVPGETMTLIVFAATGKKDNEHDYGNFDKEKFSASKTVAESGTFTVKKLEPKDKGLYFCAVSEHSDTDTAES
uniref:Ig-like domain-containing protein n=1 Tax=Amphilophus citrinellus TaxID=61819 RepID=A0A3Q0QSQ8_AMPCI